MFYRHPIRLVRNILAVHFLFAAGAHANEAPATEAVDEPPPDSAMFAGSFEPGAGDAVASYEILSQRIEPGEMRQLNWELDSAMAGLTVPTPVLVAHGMEPGPTVCLVAAIHGDELNGVEIVRRILFDQQLDQLAGTIVGIPIVNAFGFLRGSRYLPDRRDLNRFFPGALDGSMASRFAAALFREVVTRCTVLVDIHTGSFHRTNLPQLRADLSLEPVLDLSRSFGDIAVLHSTGPSGSLRRAATDIGIPAVTMEAGEPLRFDEPSVSAGVDAIESLLSHLGMRERPRRAREAQPVFYSSTWVRAQSGGILFSTVQLGDIVDKGEQLATVTDPIENGRTTMTAPFRGRVLGMAVNQVVMPGFAAFHIGRETSEQQVVEAGAATESGSGDDAAPTDLTPPEIPAADAPALAPAMPVRVMEVDPPAHHDAGDSGDHDTVEEDG